MTFDTEDLYRELHAHQVATLHIQNSQESEQSGSTNSEINSPTEDTTTDSTAGIMSPRTDRPNLPSQQKLRELANKGARQFGAKSTQHDYDRIMDEFFEYLEAVHHSKTITLPRILEYLTYTAHRPKRSAQQLKQNVPLGEPAPKRHKFSATHFFQVMGELDARDPNKEEVPSGDRIQSLKKHYAALKKNVSDKMRQDMNYDKGIQDILAYVVSRKKTADIESFQEKVNPQVEKFNYMQAYLDIEKMMWQKHQNHKCLDDIHASFCNRYTLITTVHCLL